MKVNVNNLRLQAARSYNRLCDTLNEANEKGLLRLEADEIQRDMDDLRMFLVGIVCIYQEDDPDFADLSDKIDLKVFNEEVDETNE